MDNKSRAGIELLETLGRSSSALYEESTRLNLHPNVLLSSVELECRYYPSADETTLSQFLNVELDNGIGVSLALDIRWSENEWIIWGRITSYAEQGSTTIRDFPERKTGIYSKFLSDIVEATRELLEGVDSLKLL